MDKVRISRLLAQKGLCSRREADAYIAQGWVEVEGQVVRELGTKAYPHQHIRLNPQALQQQQQRVTILLNKPIGYVSHRTEKRYKTALSLITGARQFRPDKAPQAFLPRHRRGLAPAGRLDIESQGLLVLTQDGRMARRLIGENSTIEREYLVRVTGSLDGQGLALLNHGLVLDGQALKPATVEWQNRDQLRFVLTEGKNRQIRRMCGEVGLTVTGLKRVRIGGVRLGDLPEGRWRYLRPDEAF